MTKLHRIAIANCGVTLDVAADTTILQAARAAGVAYPHGCQMGRCGTCKSRLIEGDVELLPHTPFSLTAADKARGFVLACRAQPRSDCKLAWLGSDTAEHPLRKTTGRVTAIHRAAPDISILSVMPDGAPLDFSAGQYVELGFAGCPPRNYSMANPPAEPVLVFHIRHIEGGAVSNFVASRLKVGDAVALHGPMGGAYLRPRRAGAIIAVAGGTGLAPILSVLSAAAMLKLVQPIRLYFAARTGDDLYQEREIAALTERLDDMTYAPVIGRRRDLLTRLEADLTRLETATAYVAGAPALVHQAVQTLVARGLDPSHAHADAFFTTADQVDARPVLESEAS